MNAALTDSMVLFNEGSYSERIEEEKPIPFIYWGTESLLSEGVENNVDRELEGTEDIFLTDEGIKNNVDRELNDENKLTRIQRILREQNIKKLYKVIDSDKEYLERENITPPNEKVIDFSIHLIDELASKKLFPSKISTSIEEGICFTFKKSSFLLYLEIYNDGEFGYLIEDSKNSKIIENNDVKTIVGFSKRIEQFYNQNALS